MMQSLGRMRARDLCMRYTQHVVRDRALAVQSLN
jgi:hypothetical protein